MDDEKIWKAKEVADRLGYSPKTVLQWIRSGELKAFKLGRAWLIRDSDLAAYLDSKYGSAQ